LLARKNGCGTVSELVEDNNNDNEASVEKGLSTPVQQPLPLAFINGEALIEKPEDLFIPPHIRNLRRAARLTTLSD